VKLEPTHYDPCPMWESTTDNPDLGEVRAFCGKTWAVQHGSGPISIVAQAVHDLEHVTCDECKAAEQEART